MSRRFAGAILSVLTCLILGTAACRAGYNWQTQWVSERARGVNYPSLYNGQIAWAHHPNEMYWYTDLYFWDGNEVRQLTNTPWISEGSTSLYDGEIAYGTAQVSNENIFYWDGEDFHQITFGEGKRGLPSLYKGKIVYSNKESDTDWDIYYWDSVTGETIRVCDTDLYDYYAVMYENTIAWMGGTGGNRYDIYYWDGETTIMIPSRCAKWKPSLYDGQIAWAEVFGYGDEATTEIMLWDGEEKIQLTNNSTHDVHPSLFKGMIAYLRFDGHDDEIMFWDGHTHWQVTDDDYWNRNPSLYITENGQIQIAYRRIYDMDVMEAEIVYITAMIPEPSVIAMVLSGLVFSMSFLKRRKK